MNTVDICPVGALVSSDFLYQARVWHLHSRPSICADCSVGCNTRVDMDAKGRSSASSPRRNDQVNKEWMCDYGRLSFPYVHENRLMKPMVDGKDAAYKDARKAAAALLGAEHRGPGQRLEHQRDLRRRQGVRRSRILPGAGIAGYANPGRADEVFPGFTICGDKNPNRAGMQEILGIDADASLKELAADKAPIGTLLLVHNIPGYAGHAGIQGRAGPHRERGPDGSRQVGPARYGNVAVALPTLTTFEKSGTLVNKDGIAQKFLPVMEPANFGRNEAEMLHDLARDFNGRVRRAAGSNGAAKVKA